MRATTVAAFIGAWVLIVASAMFPNVGRLLGAQASGVALTGLPVIVVMLGVLRAQRIVAGAGDARTAEVEAVLAKERTPVYPAGRGCPAGHCPICGMRDPDHLDRDGCHESCVEWLGRAPERSATREHAEIRQEIRRYEQLIRADVAAEHRRRTRAVQQAACPHDDVLDVDCFCGKCGARARYRRGH